MHFHDILGGTCIPSAYPRVFAKIGAAHEIADDMLQKEFRIKLKSLPSDPLQRIVVSNASDAPFAGYHEVEPWTQWNRWETGWNLLDESNAPVPFQILPPESAHGATPRLLFFVHLDAGATRSFRIATAGPAAASLPPMEVAENHIKSNDGVCVRLGDNACLQFAGNISMPVPTLQLIDDRSDNWSHSIDRYPDGPVTSAVWNDSCVMLHGPLSSCLLQTGQTAPLIVIGLTEMSPKEIEILAGLIHQGVHVVAVSGNGDIPPAVAELFGVSADGSPTSGKSVGKYRNTPVVVTDHTLLIHAPYDSLDTGELLPLLAAVKQTLASDLELPDGVGGYGFTMGNQSYVVLEDWREQPRTLAVRIKAKAGEAGVLAVNVDDHLPLDVSRDGDDWVIQVPTRPGDGTLICIQPK